MMAGIKYWDLLQGYNICHYIPVYMLSAHCTTAHVHSLVLYFQPILNTKFLITQFLITKFLIDKVPNNKVSKVSF